MMKTLKPVSYINVDVTGGFWKNRQDINAKATLLAVRDRFVETGRFEAELLRYIEGQPNKPYLYLVGDIGKWIEGCAYVLKKYPDPELQQWVDHFIEEFSQAVDQRTGYYHPFISNLQPNMRWQNRNWHELYLAGHMFEAAVAYAESTGNDKLLKMACKFADYIEKIFVKDQSAAFATDGHEEVELALIRLGNYTGEQRYLDLAKHFVDMRGNNDKDQPISADRTMGVDQSHCPAREQEDARGHAVRANYYYTGMADVAIHFQDEELLAACERVWNSMVNRRQYITGGLGSTHRCEGFTIDYDLPNLSAYSETCAGIAFIFFAHRMAQLTGDAKYSDAAERVLYNAFLSSTSLDGLEFFYENPLEVSPRLLTRDKDHNKKQEKMPQPHRSKVFSTSCCPPNITRLYASIGGYLYMTGEDTIYVNHYMATEAQIKLAGREVALKQDTEYPANGRIKLTVKGAKGLKLAVRLPAWCAAPAVDKAYEVEKGYAVIPVDSDEFTVRVDLPMVPFLVEANPHVPDDAGRVAVQRGPIVYCAEALDNGEGMADIRIELDQPILEIWSDEYKAYTLEVPASRRHAGDGEWLYRPLKVGRTPVTLKMMPYFAFANRELTEMRIWFLANF